MATKIVLLIPNYSQNYVWEAVDGTLHRDCTDGVYRISFTHLTTNQKIIVVPGKHPLIITQD
jgi:hypothetical protein